MPTIKENATCKITDTNHLLYTTSYTITSECGIKIKKRGANTNVHKNPAWIEKVNKEVKKMRRDISFLVEGSKSNVKKINKVKKINYKYN